MKENSMSRDVNSALLKHPSSRQIAQTVEDARPNGMVDVDFTPTGKKVLLRVNRIDQTRAGVYIPENAAGDTIETPTAWVIAVGPDVKGVRRGDLAILVASTQGWAIRRGGLKLMMVADDTVMGIVDGANDSDGVPSSLTKMRESEIQESIACMKETL